jgi:hypothetical protein
VNLFSVIQLDGHWCVFVDDPYDTTHRILIQDFDHEEDANLWARDANAIADVWKNGPEVEAEVVPTGLRRGIHLED